MNLTQRFELLWPKLKDLNAATDDNGHGETEKILAMTILGFGSFGAGILPAFISERNRQRFPLVTSLMLCFGAGILLATALVHILPEVREQMKSNWAEITICSGFFAIYFIDELIHYFFGEGIPHSNAPNNNHSHHYHNYGSLHSSESQSLLSTSQNVIANVQPTNHYRCLRQHEYGSDQDNRDENNEHVYCPNEIVEGINTQRDRTNYSEPWSQSMTGTLGLLVALCMHSSIEGLAIGVQNTSIKVLFLLGAVATHKFVMGFCLGLIIRSDPQSTLKSQIISVAVFALGTILGIGLGMIIVDVPMPWSIAALPLIQGLAGGTLLYVTVCEVITREKSKWHLNSERKFAGIAQFFTVILGFVVMCIINFYFPG